MNVQIKSSERADAGGIVEEDLNFFTAAKDVAGRAWARP